MCAGIRGSHRACEGLPPGVVKSVKTKKQRAGWVGNKSQLSRHGTRSRLAAPGNPAPPTGDPQGGGHGSPASTPDAEPKAVGFPSGPSTTRAEKSTAQEVPRMPGDRKPGVSITRPTGSISSMEKRHAPFYTKETESPFFLHSTPSCKKTEHI